MNNLDKIELLKINMKEEIKKPKLVILKLTTQCNMSCKYCYQHQNGKVDLSDVYSENTMDLIIDDIKTFIDDQTDLSIIGGEVSLFGDKILMMINKIRSSGLKFNTFCLVSNGSFGQEFIDIIKRLNLDFIKYKPRIVISIDANENLHNKLRAHNGFGLYQHVKENINRLVVEVSDKFNILTSTVLDFSNIKNLDEIDLHSNGINIKFRRQNLIPVYKMDFTKHDFKLHAELCNKIGDSIINILNSDELVESDILYGLQGLDILHLKDILFENFLNKRTCDIGYLKSYLPNGDITSCHQRINIRTDLRYSYGSLTDPSIPDYSKPLTEFVQSSSPCLKCKFNGLCQGACMNLDNKNKCIPWRRAQSVNMFNTWKRILSIDDFFNKYMNFLKRLNLKTNNDFLYIEKFFNKYELLIKQEIKNRYEVDLNG